MSAASLPALDELRLQARRLPGTQGWGFEWVLKRNCSLAPRQLMAVFASLCVVSLGIAAVCWALGATLVMPFAWLELIAVGAAIYTYAQHATDRERIALSEGRLLVEHEHGGRVDRAEFRPEWVRVEPCSDDRSLIELSGQGQRIAVGRYVRPELRRGLAQEFRRALRQVPEPGRQPHEETTEDPIKATRTAR
jgi:uncharacterized membrane protein